MTLRERILKFFCPVGEKERREFRKEVARMRATAEDMSRTVTLYRKGKHDDAVHQK